MNKGGAIELSNPFPGLRPFREDEEHLFFGRESQVDTMVDKMASTRFLAVVGTSGSGKSSLVNCGLRPALHRGLMATAGTSWRMAQFRPGSNPLRAMARALAKDGVLFRGFQTESLTLEDMIEASLRMSKLGLIDIYEQAHLSEDVNLLVVVDQFEELFRYRTVLASVASDGQGQSQGAVALVNLLLEAKAQVNLPIYIVLTMRSDFLGDCAEVPGLPEAINEGQYLVPRLTREERRAAIAGPLAVARGEISPVLLTRLINDVGDNPDQLPILQHALNRTWARWQQDGGEQGPLELSHYEAIGTMAHALDKHAEEAYVELETERQMKICEKIFRALTDKGTDARGTRRPTPFATLCALAEATPAEVTQVIDAFRKPSRSFLMPPLPEVLEPDTVIDISHESMMRVWKRATVWAEEEAESARLYRRLADAALRQKAGRAALWRDPELRLALDWRKRESPNEAWAMRYDPNFATAIAFLDASQRRRNIASGIRCATISALAVLTITSGYAAWSAHRFAQQALSRQLTAQSLADVDTLPQRSLLLAAESIGLARDTGIFHSEDAAQLLHTLLGATGGVPLTGHASAVKAVAFSPDGGVIATGSADGTARLWNAVRPQVAPILLRGHEGQVTGLAFSPDGHWLATTSADRTARLWDAVHPQTAPVVLSGHQKAINAIAISADSRWLATASEDSTARLWDLKAADPSVDPFVLRGHTKGVTAVAFSRTGRWLATASHVDHTVWLWDMMTSDPANTGRKMTHKVPISSGEDAINAIAFSPDERRLAVTFGYDVQVWDLTAPDPTAMPLLKGSHRQWILAVGFSPDGHWLATGSIDATIKLWDLTASDPATRPIVLYGHRAAIKTLAFSSTGRWLATGGEDATARLWDLTDPTSPSVLLRGHESSIDALTFSPDGLRLATASSDAQARLWDIPDVSLDRIVLRGHSQTVLAVAFSRDTKWLATGSDDHTTRLWNLTNLHSTPLASGTAGPVDSASFSPDGHWLVTAGREDPVVRLWNLTAADLAATPIELRPIQWIINLGFSPNGRWLATASWDGRVRLWSLATGTPLPKPDFLCSEPEPAQGLAFTADGRELATGSHGYTARLWKLTDENPCAHPIVIAHAGFVVNDLAINRDGSWLATTSWEPEFQAKLWHLTDAAPSAPSAVLQFKDRVFSVAFSPDMHWMAAASWDATAQLLDVTNPTKAPIPLLGHQGRILGLAFSPDGQSLASFSEDHTMRLWDPARPTAEPTVLHDVMGFSKMAFSPDGRWIATGSNDGTVRLWVLGVDELIRIACRTAGRNLSKDEWQTFLGRASYRKTCPALPGSADLEAPPGGLLATP